MDGHYVNGNFNFSSGHGPTIATSQPQPGHAVQYPQGSYQTSHPASFNFPSLAPLQPQPQRPSGSYTHGVYDQSVSQVPQRSLLTSHQLPSGQTSQPPSYLQFPATSSTYSTPHPNQNYSLGSNYGQQQSFQPPFQHSNASMPELGRLPSLQPFQFTGINQANTALNGQSLRPSSMSIPTLEQTRNIHPAHVVGSQGRRGILPSAEGRPSAVSHAEAGTSDQAVVNNKNANIPTKDADGKFPCLHCNKTYLHAKHLKRHLLRRKCCRRLECYMHRLITSCRYGRSPLHVHSVHRQVLSQRHPQAPFPKMLDTTRQSHGCHPSVSCSGSR